MKSLNATLNSAERKVFKAALGCVHRRGFAYLMDRRDANFVTINEPAFQRLEKAVGAYRDLLKRNRRRKA